MSRVKLTEYRAKKLILGEAYQGISFGTKKETKFPHRGTFVVKVDQGIKKRFKHGLVALNVPASGIERAVAAWKKKGFSRFIAEPMFVHDSAEEQYLSLERVRDGVRVLHARDGGIDIESHPEAVTQHIISERKNVHAVSRETGIPEDFLRRLCSLFEEVHMSFLEINPLIIRGSHAHPLDAAALVDDAGMFFSAGAWDERDIVESRIQHPREARVAELQRTTPASLKLTVMNPNGSLFFLLSGGGGSIVIADEAQLLDAGGEIGNYGEYSGGPTREETYLYAQEVLGLLLDSSARRKALIIAGGIANFTDVLKTFAGVVDALNEVAPALRKAGVKVFIRRGGPNERAGLAHIRAYLEREGLLGSVHGSEAIITAAIDDAIAFIKKT